MPIRLTCPTCATKMQTSDTAVGKTVKCPGCQSLISVTEADAAASAAAPPAGPEELKLVTPVEGPATQPKDAEVPAAETGGPPAGGPLKDDDKLWGVIAHVSGIFFWAVGPLIVFLVKKKESAFLENQSKEALNFQLTLLPAALVLGLLSSCAGCGGALIPGVFAGVAGGIASAVGGLLSLVLWIGNIIFSVMGAMAANKGEWYKYPYSLRWIK
jgi:uncharacterized Tic20 family protein